jgi:hypothetical protein
MAMPPEATKHAAKKRLNIFSESGHPSSLPGLDAMSGIDLSIDCRTRPSG